MRAEEAAKLERINEKKSKSDVTHPLEPLIMSIVKGFVDDEDLSSKLQALYKVGRGAAQTMPGRYRGSSAGGQGWQGKGWELRKTYRLTV